MAPHLALAGCLSFLDPPENSACTTQSSQLSWSHPARLLERVKLPPLAVDRELYDAALAQGLAVRGDLEFTLRVPGPHLVEVFLAAPDDGRYSFILEAAGRTIDARHQAVPQPDRPRPRAGPRSVCLLGVFSGPFTVRSDSPRYFLSMVRWTAQETFEENLAPAWLDRARQLAADPFFENLRAARRENLEQLYDRLALSTRPEIRREAVTGQARAAYWLAAADQQPRDIARTDALFREAFKLAPDDRLLRQMISASCKERNVRSGRMPYSSYCAEAAPVPWSITLPPDPPEAPEWAVIQRRLAARLEAITRWWVEQRQRPNGELGGGWDGDFEMLRQWAPVALGFGSPAAGAGLRRLADGLWNEGRPGLGPSRQAPSDGPPPQAVAEAQALLAALSPEEAGVLARLRGWPEPVLGPALWHAFLTRDKSTIELLAGRAGSWMSEAPSLRATSNPDQMASLLLAAHELTGEARFLQAAGERFQVLARCGEAAGPCDEIRRAPEIFLEWRRKTGDSRYDSAARYRGEPLPTEVLWNLTFAGRESEAFLSRDFDMYTSEVIRTDRVYYPLTAEYLQHLFGGGGPRGDRFPAFAVTWPPSETQFARAVVASSPQSLRLRVFSFEARPSSAQVRLWRLEPGRYRWAVAEPFGAAVASGDLVVSRRAQGFLFPLPAARELEISIQPAPAEPAPPRRSFSPSPGLPIR